MYKFKLAQLPVSMSFPHFHASMTHDHYFQTSFLNNLHNNIIIILLIIRPYIPFKVPSHLKKNTCLIDLLSFKNVYYHSGIKPTF